MRLAAPFTTLLIVTSFACDEQGKSLEGRPVEGATASAPTSPPAAPPPATPSSMAPSGASAAADGDAGAGMPPRPIPKPDNTVGSAMPQETQMRAITYMSAMRAPRPGDANADVAYAEALAKKLDPISKSLDHGPDKAKMNRTEVSAGGRQIDLLMSLGCGAKAPFQAVVQRSGTPLSALFSHGVLVVRCNDSRVQCLQSTRDADDVLCTTAPRHR